MTVVWYLDGDERKEEDQILEQIVIEYLGLEVGDELSKLYSGTKWPLFAMMMKQFG